MEKLKELLSKLGSEELTNKICEELDTYEQKLKVGYDKKFNEKVEKLQKVGLEEIDKVKLDLARKVAVYLESKTNAIDDAAKRQHSLEESENTLKLKRIMALLEDRDPNAVNSDKELQAERTVVNNLTRATKQLKEERDTAIRKANHANRVASDTLKRNKELEEALKAKPSTIAETTKAAPKKASAPVVESKEPVKAKLSEERVVPSTPQTQRKPLVATKPQLSQENSIRSIADAIDEDI